MSQVRASRFSSGYGAKVACAELPFAFVSGEKAGGLGGTCVLRGCVPKKLFMYCGEYAEYIKDAEGFGCAPPMGLCAAVVLHALLGLGLPVVAPLPPLSGAPRPTPSGLM